LAGCNTTSGDPFNGRLIAPPPTGSYVPPARQQNPYYPGAPATVPGNLPVGADYNLPKSSATQPTTKTDSTAVAADSGGSTSGWASTSVASEGPIEQASFQSESDNSTSDDAAKAETEPPLRISEP
jgi:hypothetical protein